MKLSHAAQGLNLGVNVQNLFNREADAQAIREDMDALFERQAELVRELVQKVSDACVKYY